MIHPLISPTFFTGIRFMIYALIKSVISLNPIILFMIIGDILLTSYLFYIIYRTILRLFDSSYFSFDTICKNTIFDDQLNKFTTILRANVQKTTNTLKCIDGMSDNFDLDTISDTTDAYINNIIKNDIKTNIKHAKTLRIDVDIKNYINDISQIICCELNKIAYAKNKIIRFTFAMENGRNNGSFTINTILRYNTVNINHSVYSVSDNSSKKTYYLTEYTPDIHNFFIMRRNHSHYYRNSCEMHIYDNINILETTIIDGMSRAYIMIDYDNHNTSYSVGKNSIIEIINQYTLEHLVY